MEKSLGYIYSVILLLNLAIVSLVSLVIFQTTYVICDSDQARFFLEQARYLPHIPWHVPVYSISSFLLLAVSSLIKRRLSESQALLAFALFVIDICVAFFITYNLNFAYKGLFLFLGVGAFFFINHIPLRYTAIALVMLSYTFADYDIISVQFNMVSLQDYIGFYTTNLQIPLYSIRSTLESLNLMLVILFFQLLIQSKIRENKEFIKVNNELSDKLHQLEILQAKLEESARLKERNRLAHEIHDILGHSLTSISTGLEACIELSVPEPSALRTRLMKIKRVTDRGLVDIRRSVRELKNDAIAKSSLLTALRQMVDDANAIDDRTVTLTIKGEPQKMEDDEEQTVYRLVQESLTNSLRHAKSKRIDVSLSYSENQLLVLISDDGKGCSRIVKHFGLEHIEEKVSFLGGTVVFESSPGAGFKTLASIPLRKGGGLS